MVFKSWLSKLGGEAKQQLVMKLEDKLQAVVNDSLVFGWIIEAELSVIGEHAAYRGYFIVIKVEDVRMYETWGPLR